MYSQILFLKHKETSSSSFYYIIIDESVIIKSLTGLLDLATQMQYNFLQNDPKVKSVQFICDKPILQL